MTSPLHPGTRVRKNGTKQTGCVYQFDPSTTGRAFVQWDDGRFVREREDDLSIASAVDELAALEAKRKNTAPSCDPQMLRALRAELHQHPGGHQPEVQADVAKLCAVAARFLLGALRDQRSALNRARSQPWRKIP